MLLECQNRVLTIRHLYVSPGHNFFGHHERPPGQNPTIEVNEIKCVAGRGIRGDRFFDYKENYKGQITFLSAEVFHDLCRDLAVTGKTPDLLRRNVVVSGVELNLLIGETFEIQGVKFAGVCECSPCYWMDQAIAPGAEQWLRGRGGLRARILTDGKLCVNP